MKTDAKVVRLNKVAPVQSPTSPAGRLPVALIQLRDKAAQQLKQAMQALFDNADDTLFEMADRAANNAEQSAYFEAMRDLRLKRKGIELVVGQGDAVPARLKGDPLRLRQALLNYANNALKFTTQGEIEVRVDRVEAPDDAAVTLRFSVREVRCFDTSCPSCSAPRPCLAIHSSIAASRSPGIVRLAFTLKVPVDDWPGSLIPTSYS
mgnify:CR=1 FL=1